MSKEILKVANSVSNEKGVPAEVIFQAIELALATATKKRYNTEVEIIVKIDKKTGDYQTLRIYRVVKDEDFDIPGIHLTLDEGKELDETLEIGDTWEEQVESVDFGRIAAQTAKQVIVQKVREAERRQIVESYRNNVGEMLSGTVKKSTRELYIIDLGNNAEAIMPKNQTIPRDNFRLGSNVKGVLVEIAEEEGKAPQMILSRTHSNMLVELFRLEVPEINEQIIEIKTASRDPGSRAKIAVKTNDGRIDPIGACVGMRGARVQAVSNELQNERVDIVLWDEDPIQLVINAMQPAEVGSIVVDEENHVMDIAVQEDTLAQAIGRGGQNVRLASDLSGWTLNVMTEAESKIKQAQETDNQLATLSSILDIDEGTAQKLIMSEITSANDLADLSIEELLNIEGITQETAEALQSKAKNAVSTEKNIAKVEKKPEFEIVDLKGMNEFFIKEFSNRGISDLESLAEQSTDEILDIEGMSTILAADLIMQARNICWFGEEK